MYKRLNEWLKMYHVPTQHFIAVVYPERGKQNPKRNVYHIHWIYFPYTISGKNPLLNI